MSIKDKPTKSPNTDPNKAKRELACAYIWMPVIGPFSFSLQTLIIFGKAISRNLLSIIAISIAFNALLLIPTIGVVIYTFLSIYLIVKRFRFVNRNFIAIKSGLLLHFLNFVIFRLTEITIISTNRRDQGSTESTLVAMGLLLLLQISFAIYYNSSIKRLCKAGYSADTALTLIHLSGLILLSAILAPVSKMTHFLHSIGFDSAHGIAHDIPTDAKIGSDSVIIAETDISIYEHQHVDTVSVLSTPSELTASASSIDREILHEETLIAVVDSDGQVSQVGAAVTAEVQTESTETVRIAA